MTISFSSISYIIFLLSLIKINSELQKGIITGTVFSQFSSYQFYLTFNKGRLSLKKEISLSHNQTLISLKTPPPSFYEHQTNWTDLSLGGDNNEVIDETILYGQPIKNFHFILNHDDNNYINDHIGFALNIKPQFSLVHLLKQQNIIYKTQFGFSKVLFESPVINIYFGGFPNETTFNKTSSKCYTKREFTYWGCELKTVSISGSNYQYINKDNSFFSTKENDIIVPLSFITYIQTEFFLYYEKSHLCCLSFYNTSEYYICSPYVINQDNTTIMFDFGLNEGLITLNISQVFKCNNFLCDCYIKGKSQDIQEWIFGCTFMKQFDILFDYDDASITFYYEKTTQNSKLLIINFYTFNIIILSAFLLYNIIVLLSNNILFSK